MASNNLVRWGEELKSAGRYTFISLFVEYTSFEVNIHLRVSSPSQEILTVTIQGVLAFRRTAVAYADTTDILRIVKSSDKMSLFHDWPFFIIENSDYAQLLYQESCCFYPAEGFTHFVIVTNDTIIDLAILNFDDESVQLKTTKNIFHPNKG